jgi:hypothetical protein
MRGLTRRLSVVGLAGFSLVACGPSAGASPGGPSAAGWKVVARVVTPGRQPILVSSDAPSRHNAWVLGFDLPKRDPELSSAVPVLEHWDGRAWLRATLPAKAVRNFAMLVPFHLSVRVSPASGIWMFNSRWLRIVGTKWQGGPLPSPGQGWAVDTDDAAVIQRTDVWVVGGAFRKSVLRPYAARFNGTRWKLTTLPGTGQVASVSAMSARDLWAVLGTPAIDLASQQPPPAVGAAVVRWNGSRWLKIALPSALTKHGYLTSILAHGDHDVQIAGGIRTGTTLEPVLARWNGQRWSVARLPGSLRGYVVSSLASDGQGGAWAAGICATCRGLKPAVVWHLRDGRWSAPLPNYAGTGAVALTLAQVGHTSSVLGVGLMKTQTRVDGMIALHGNLSGG